MKAKFRTILIFNLLLLLKINAQSETVPSQPVKGNIINSTNQSPVSFATIRIMGTNKGAISSKNGDYKIKDVPIGRYNLQATFVGFESQTISIVVSSGKEVVVNFELKEKVIKTQDVNVSATKESSLAINESAITSSTQFTLDDVSRFAGSLNDPARMAQNFAGVIGANDQRNDIIIRGGSPTELLWRLDNLDIPNPNHFATEGSSGGPICALNTTLLANSDFLTGAFPAEYGDKLSGVFDLKTRKGNRDKFEYLGQIGFNGFELGAEGPIKFADGSFIINYRYSFLSLLELMGISFGFSGIPKYQDVSIKGDFDLNENNKLSITGLWGKSAIDNNESEDDEVITGDFDTKVRTDLLAIAVNLQSIFSNKLYGNLTLGICSSAFQSDEDSLTTDDIHTVISKDKWFSGNSIESFLDAKYTLFYTPKVSHTFLFGFTSRYKFYNLKQERFTVEDDETDLYKLSADGDAMQYLGFINWNWRINEDITAVLGIHGQYLTLSDKSSIEPRASLSWRFMPNQRLNLGFGVHSQSLPLGTYYQDNQNKNLDFMQAIHYVTGYTLNFDSDAYLKVEAYYKDISKAPIESSASAYSYLNAGANFGNAFGEDSLVSLGLGRTYGAEFSFVKNFTDGYYITTTFSLVRQKYKASDAVWRWGAFDNIFILNLLAGYEWKVKNNFTIEYAGKYTLAGGTPYTPIDEIKSALNNDTYRDNNNAFGVRKPLYSRLDIKVDFRWNNEGWALIGFVSIQNILNQKNVLKYSWDKSTKSVEQKNQLGFFPMAGFKIEF